MKSATPNSKKITLFVSLITLTYLLLSVKFESSVDKMPNQFTHHKQLSK